MPRFLARLVPALFSLVASCTRPAPPPRPPLAAPAPARASLDRQGHRGARGLRPENTLLAFEKALDLGVETLEMDLLLTRDDLLVVHHDERLNPDTTRDASGAWLSATGPAIRSLTRDELARYDVGRIRPGTAYAARFAEQQGSDGVRIPTFAEVVALAERRAPGRIRYNVEVKTTPARPEDTAPPAVVADAVIALARERGILARTTVQSFDWRALRRVREIAPTVATSCLTSDETVARGAPGPSPWTAGLDVDALGGSVPRLVHAAGCTLWSPDYATITSADVALAHQLGVGVVPWTVNEPDAMRRLIAWGVDGIISDYPDRLVAVAPRR